MIKKVLLIETTLVSAFIAAFFSIASMSKSNQDTLASNDIQTSVQSAIQTSVQSATHASTSTHSIYKLGGVYPQP